MHLEINVQINEYLFGIICEVQYFIPFTNKLFEINYSSTHTRTYSYAMNNSMLKSKMNTKEFLAFGPTIELT